MRSRTLEAFQLSDWRDWRTQELVSPRVGTCILLEKLCQGLNAIHDEGNHIGSAKTGKECVIASNLTLARYTLLIRDILL